jgi:DNA helicase II / ATP-dependent DNA helicase PcrA
MHLTVDLHSHSGYAGGVGQIELSSIAAAMKLKGIDVFGTGDCLLPQRTKELQAQLRESAEGLFSLAKGEAKFLLQTEVIFTTGLPEYKTKIIAHHLILFPDFRSIAKMNQLMRKWNMKNTIGRPFITSKERGFLEEQLWEIKHIDPLIEIIPAHVMTPEGILGSRNNLNSMQEFYGSFLSEISSIETGLSADPQMLEKIPELAELTFISNSDCHSSALNRIGREFTVLNVKEITYPEIISALRNNQVEMTAEFNPAEGRFYLTGHRSDRKDHKNAVIYNENAPADLLCPECGRKMNLGVKERCMQLTDDKIKPVSRKIMHLIPLIEVIAFSQNIKSVNSSRVKNIFSSIMEIFPSEIALWRSDRVKELLDKRIDPKTINCISAVKAGRFTFDPPGFDGCYGNLIIGV